MLSHRFPICQTWRKSGDPFAAEADGNGRGRADPRRTQIRIEAAAESELILVEVELTWRVSARTLRWSSPR